MNKSVNLYDDIKGLIEKYFEFLIHFDFKPFSEQQSAYEYHFKTFNNYVNIDIWYEQIYSTPIWIKINGLYVEHIELANEKVKEYYNALYSTYAESFDLIKIEEQYALNGKFINDSYLKEISSILKRNPEILYGNLNLLVINTEIIRRKNENIVLEEKKQNEIYTLEIDLWNNGEYSAEVEFKHIEELKKYLKENKNITKYRLLDFNQNEVKFK